MSELVRMVFEGSLFHTTKNGWKLETKPISRKWIFSAPGEKSLMVMSPTLSEVSDEEFHRIGVGWVEMLSLRDKLGAEMKL